VAVVREDAIGVELPEPVEVVQVGLEVLRLVHVGDRVLHRVAAEE
jgi:hypothetical protein